MMELLARLQPTIKRDGDVVTLEIDNRFKMFQARVKNHLETIAEQYDARKVRLKWGDFREEQELDEKSIDVKILYSSDVAGSLENRLKELFFGAANIALDLETDSTDGLTCNVIGVGLTSLETGNTCYIPTAHNNCEGNYDVAEVFACVEKLVDPARIVVHNLSFETKILGRYGVAFDHHLIRDTMIYSYISNSSKKKGLKSIVADRYSIRMTTYEDVSKSYKNFADVPVDQAAEYCGADTYWTATLLRDFEKEMQTSPELIRLVDLDHRVALACSYMETVGLHVDEDRLNNFSLELSEKCSSMEREMQALVGREDFNPKSSKQVKEYLYGDLGISDEGCKNKKTGKQSSDAAALSNILSRGEDNPFVLSLSEYRKINKLLTTYTTKIIDRINRTTDRLHTSLMYTGTETGRFASSAPNLQNLPASGDGKEVRCCIIPPKNRSFIVADYSQLELRVLAHLMNDQRVIDLFIAGHDAHSATASAVFKKPPEDIGKDSIERRVGKTLNFALIYGQGVYNTAKQLNISKEQAQEYTDIYFEAFPDLAGLRQDYLNICRKTQYVPTLLGRRRWLPDIKSADWKKRGYAERQTFNMAIQGTAAEVVRCAMIRVYEELLPRFGGKADMHLQVHDEIVCSCDEGVIDEFKLGLIEVMEEPFMLDGKNLLEIKVPLKVDVGVAENYGEAK